MAKRAAASLDILGQPTRKVASKQRPTNNGSPWPATVDHVPQTSERSILDFGRVHPDEGFQAPTIVLDIPLVEGETNKCVNFLRLAEEQFGWDALHPRQAVNRDRKARIAAASAALEKAGAGSGRESGDEMSVDLSDIEASNAEIGASGLDVQEKPIRKKRNFKEDEYDVDDDFVDDSELQWENQAAASRDGFFVYMGPLVREVEKASAPGSESITRGRGRRGGPGSRGGRGGSGRGAPNGIGKAVGRGGGGPGSRGGVTRKPRGAKAEKAQREKAERDNVGVLQPTTPSLSALP